MWYRTDLMDKILQNDAAKRLVDYVSDIYGESYVGLWLFQVMGQALDEVNLSILLLFNEIFPNRSDILLPYWEKEYGITPNEYLSIEERQNNLLKKINSRQPMNPKRMEMLVENLCKRKCEVIEYISPFTFEIRIGSGDSYVNLRDVIDLIGDIKPAHLNYKIACTCYVNLGVKANRSPWKVFFIETGTIPKINTGLAITQNSIEICPDINPYKTEYEFSSNESRTGTIPHTSTGLSLRSADIEIQGEGTGHRVQYPETGESGPAGTYPILSTALSLLENSIGVLPDTEDYKMEHTMSSENAKTGTEPRISTGLSVMQGGVEVKPGAESYLVISGEAGTEPQISTGYEDSEGGVLPKVKTETWRVDFTLCGDESGI